jgi:hypothetical protein
MSEMNDIALQREDLKWEEALDLLFWELELCECDPPENEWQVGYEAALRDAFFKLVGHAPSDTLH